MGEPPLLYGHAIPTQRGKTNSPADLTLNCSVLTHKEKPLASAPGTPCSSSLHLMGDGANCFALCKPGALSSIKSQMGRTPGSGMAYCSIHCTPHKFILNFVIPVTKITFKGSTGTVCLVHHTSCTAISGKVHSEFIFMYGNMFFNTSFLNSGFNRPALRFYN